MSNEHTVCVAIHHAEWKIGGSEEGKNELSSEIIFWFVWLLKRQLSSPKTIRIPVASVCLCVNDTTSVINTSARGDIHGSVASFLCLALTGFCSVYRIKRTGIERSISWLTPRRSLQLFTLLYGCEPRHFKSPSVDAVTSRGLNFDSCLKLSISCVYSHKSNLCVDHRFPRGDRLWQGIWLKVNGLIVLDLSQILFFFPPPLSVTQFLYFVFVCRSWRKVWPVTNLTWLC